MLLSTVSEDTNSGVILTDEDRSDKAIDLAHAQTWLKVIQSEWPGRTGGRDYRLMRTFVGLALQGEARDDGWVVRIGRRELAEVAGMSSKRGLEVAIDHLVSQGWISILSRGSADRFTNGAGTTGHRASFLVVRQRGSKPTVVHEEHRDSSSSMYYYSPMYRPPLPDNSTDLAIEEPHLLRMLDLIRTGLVDSGGWTYSSVAAVLGMARQSAWEAVERWAERGDFVGGCFNATMAPTYERNDAHRRIIESEVKCRKSAHAGTWSPIHVKVGTRINGVGRPRHLPRLKVHGPLLVIPIFTG